MGGVGGLCGEDVEVAVLAGFGEGVGFLAATDVGGHAEEEVGDGDFVVGELGGEGGVAVPPVFAGLDALEVVAFEVAFVSGGVAVEGEVDGCAEVLEVGGFVVDDFAAFAAHEESLAADPGEVLVGGEVEDAEAVAEVEGGDELLGVGDFFCEGRALAGGALEEGRGEAAGGDGCLFGADAEETADEADTVVAVAGGELDLADASEAAAAGEGEAGGVVGLAMELFCDLDAGALLVQSPKFGHFCDGGRGRRFGKDGHILFYKLADDGRIGRQGDAGDDEVGRFGGDHFGG